MKIEHVKPHISIFTGEQMELVHRNSIHILKNTGIKTSSLKALNIFKKAGDVIIHGDKVKMSGDIVRWAIEKCPKSIQIYDRAGMPALISGMLKLIILCLESELQI